MATSADPDPDEATPADTATEGSNRRLLAGLGVAAALAAGGLWYASRPAPAPLQGTVEAEEVSVASKAFARIVSLAAEEGDTVAAGHVLGQLSSPLRDTLVDQSTAAADSAAALATMAAAGPRGEDVATLRSISVAADAQAHLAAVTAGRMDRLYAEGVIAAQRRDEAAAARTAAAANAEAARAQYRRALAGTRDEVKAIADAQDRAAQQRLDAAKAAAGEDRLVAPMAGTISRRLAAPGEVVGPAVPVFRILDTAHPFVTLRVGESRLAGVARGRILEGRVPALGEAKIRFRVAAVSAEAGFASEQATRQGDDYDARSFALKLLPEPGAKGLLPGMSVLFDWPQ